MQYIKIIIIFSFFILNSCSNNNQKVPEDIIQNNIEDGMIKAYNEGVKALKTGDATYASKKFNVVAISNPVDAHCAKVSAITTFLKSPNENIKNPIAIFE